MSLRELHRVKSIKAVRHTLPFYIWKIVQLSEMNLKYIKFCLLNIPLFITFKQRSTLKKLQRSISPIHLGQAKQSRVFSWIHGVQYKQLLFLDRITIDIQITSRQNRYLKVFVSSIKLLPIMASSRVICTSVVFRVTNLTLFKILLQQQQVRQTRESDY